MLKTASVPHLLKIIGIERHNPNRDHQGNKQINDTRRPLSHIMQFAGALLLKIFMEPAQCFVELATDFTGRVLM